jgi:hypothetical protein
LAVRAAGRLNNTSLTYLIQSLATHEYFQKGNWTLESGWAEEFPNSAKALDTCLRHDLREVELVLQFGIEAGRNYQLRLAVPEWLLWP